MNALLIDKETANGYKKKKKKEIPLRWAPPAWGKSVFISAPWLLPKQTID